jgi:hypothetical protein
LLKLPCFYHRITIPASQLASMANTDYFVQATVTNYLGATASAVWAFTKAAAGTAPVIVPLATGTVNYKVAEGVRVGVQLVAASVCSGKQVRQVAGGWHGCYMPGVRTSAQCMPPLLARQVKGNPCQEPAHCVVWIGLEG